MRRSNKALYEQIMKNVSKQVKRALNEVGFPGGDRHKLIFDGITDLAVENGYDPSSEDWKNIIKKYLKTVNNLSKMNDLDVINIFRYWALGKPYMYKFTEADFKRYIKNNTVMKLYINSDNIDPIYDSNLKIMSLLFDNIDKNEMRQDCIFDYDEFVSEASEDGDVQIMIIIADIINGKITPLKFSEFVEDMSNGGDLDDYYNPYNKFNDSFSK